MSELQTETSLNAPRSFPGNIFLAPDGRLRATWRVVISVILFLCSAYAAAFIATILQGKSVTGFEIVYRPLMFAFLCLWYALLWRGADEREAFFENVGLGWHRTWIKDFGVGTLGGFLLIAIAVALIAIIGDYRPNKVNDPASRIVLLLLAQVWVLVWGAIAEEMAFRGYPFQRMIEAWGPLPAVCVSSLLFGSVHLLNPHFAVLPMLNTMLIGAFFAVVFLKTNSLWIPWGLHFGWNFALGVIFGLPVSGLYQFAVVNKAVATGPQWLTGGDYGIEASVTAAVLITLAIIASTLWWPQKRESPVTSAGI